MFLFCPCCSALCGWWVSWQTMSKCSELCITEFIHITILITVLFGYVFQLSVKFRLQGFHTLTVVFKFTTKTRTPQTPFVKHVNIISFLLNILNKAPVHKMLLWKNNALPTLASLAGVNFENTVFWGSVICHKIWRQFVRVKIGSILLIYCFR